MDARTAYYLWRRVLREPMLRESVCDSQVPLHELTLTPAEQGIAEVVRTHRASAYWPCEGYRYRVVSQGVSALQLGAPLTYRSLRNAGSDMRALAEDFANASDWQDDGHYTFTSAQRFLAYLRGRVQGTTGQTLRTVADVSDAISIDWVRCDLMRQTADLDDAQWTRPDADAQLDRTRSYQRASTAVGVTTVGALSAWLMDLDVAGVTPLEPTPQYFVLSLPSRAVEPEYALLGTRAQALFEALRNPLTMEQAQACLNRLEIGEETDPADNDAEELLLSLLRNGYATVAL